MGDVTSHDNARLLALLAKNFKQGFHRNGIGIHAHHAVLGLVVAGESRTSSRRIGDVVAGRMRIDHTDVWKLGESHLFL